MKPETALIRRLVAVFGEPKTDDPEVYLMEFERALSGWADEILQLAGDKVINESVFWPKPAEVLAAARGIAGDLARKRAKPEHQPIYTNNASEEEKARVKELVRFALMNIRRHEIEPPAPSDAVASNRDEFTAMQRCSPNRFHRRHC